MHEKRDKAVGTRITPTQYQTLQVHCCCDPARRFGWAPTVAGQTARVSYVLASGRRIDTEIAPLRLPIYPLTLYVCAHGNRHVTIPVWRTVLAVKSADYPIEDWRQVPGFVEDVENRAEEF